MRKQTGISQLGNAGKLKLRPVDKTSAGLKARKSGVTAALNDAERFAALHDAQVFRIGETGFGTGLNFLCAWRLFEQAAPAIPADTVMFCHCRLRAPKRCA